jgi:hypothetical protein
MKSWPDIEKLFLDRLIRKIGPLSPEDEEQALQDIRAMFEAMPEPTGASEGQRLFCNKLKARYGGPVAPDSNWFRVAMQVVGTELIIVELPDRAEFYEEMAGRMLWWAASERKLHEVAAAMEALDSSEVFHPLHLKILETYERARRTDRSPPSCPELQAEFLRHYNAALLPKGYALRKMVVRTLGLPLSRAKRGRPKIRNQKG